MNTILSLEKKINEIHELGLLFEEVQMKRIFPDSKTFVDCIQKRELSSINEQYLEEKDRPDFDLKSFVEANFDIPRPHETGYRTDASKTAEEHIQELWSVLRREPSHSGGSLIPLPFPYIVPGGRFQEIYYWDSYFTMLGLQISQEIDLIHSMIDNFSYLINQFGYIPNANRTYFLGRSQPPFFSLMVKLLSQEKGDTILIDYLPILEKEYNFWMKDAECLDETSKAFRRVVRMPNGTIMNRYWDENDTPRPESYKEDVDLAKQSKRNSQELWRDLRSACESGWDFSSRWFRDEKTFDSIHTTEIIPVDLNCILLHLEEVLAEAYKLSNNLTSANHYIELAQKRREAIQTYCWNEDKSYYFDYDFVANTYKNSLSIAGVFPLFFGVAMPNQAKKVALVLQENLLQKSGFMPTVAFTGQQWDAPNGWPPLQWIAYQGLRNYGFDDLAEKAKKRWVDLLLKVYRSTGKMTEKYNVFHDETEAGGGEYPNQDGFGWTNGVLLKMLQNT